MGFTGVLSGLPSDGVFVLDGLGGEGEGEVAFPEFEQCGLDLNTC